jgi:(p)ppGpp synthase/HD superfamily hydrolase
MKHGIIHSRSQGLIDYAYRFAKEAHDGQERKYTGEPYIVHPVSVAKKVQSVTDGCESICAALLHDTIEDTSVTYNDIDKAFGYSIARLVLELTEFSVKEDGNRATRKALDARYLGRASARAQTVKLADLIDNTSSIVEHDPGFARTYMEEKVELLSVLTKGDGRLMAEAIVLVKNFEWNCMAKKNKPNLGDDSKNSIHLHPVGKLAIRNLKKYSNLNK